MRVLIINHTHVECGVFQFGKRVYDLASRSTNVDYYYKIIGSHDEYVNVVNKIKPDVIIYNYHWDRMPWLTEKDIKSYKEIKHLFCFHDGSLIGSYDKYLFFGSYDSEENSVPKEKRILLPRPLFEYAGLHPKNDTITFGSFGFCSTYKGFPQLVKLINESFNHAVINLHITIPWFGEIPGYKLYPIVDACRKNNTKKDIKLNITSNFLDDNGLLTFLAGNDINILNYEETKNSGLSSAPDYLLSVKRPIAVRNVSLLRHVINDDNSLEKNTLSEILQKGITPLEPYYNKWSIEKYISDLDKAMMELI